MASFQLFEAYRPSGGRLLFVEIAMVRVTMAVLRQREMFQEIKANVGRMRVKGVRRTIIRVQLGTFIEAVQP